MKYKLKTLLSVFLFLLLVGSALSHGQDTAAPVQSTPAQTTGSAGTTGTQSTAGAPAQAPQANSPTSPTAQSGGAKQDQTTTKKDDKKKSTQTTTKAPQATGKAGITKGAKAKKGKQAKPPKPPKKPWQEFKLPNKKLSLDFTDANVDKVLSIYMKASGITILKDPSFKSPLTLESAKAVSLDEAFNILNTALTLYGFEIQKRDTMLVVSKPAPPQPPPQPMVAAAPPPQNDKPVLKTYKLKNANAKEVARIVNEVFTPQSLQDIMQQLQQAGGNPQQMMMMRMQQGGQQQQQPQKILRATYDDYTNAVVVTAPPKDQEDVAALIKDLDTVADTALTTKMFHIHSVQASEVVDALNEVLNANAPTGRGGSKGSQDQNEGYPFFFYGGGNNQKTKLNGQTVTEIKGTNTVIVTTTEDNMKLVQQVIDELDRPAKYVDTTFFLHLKNAKATDVATLLQSVFKPAEGSTGRQFNEYYFFNDSGSNQLNQNKVPTDIDEDGEFVNVRDLTGKVNVIADPNTNSLVVVTLPSNMPMVKDIVEKLDKVADQVLIETIIVEATLDNTTKLGIEFNGIKGKSQGGTNFGLASGNATTPLQGFTYTLTGSDYSAFLNMLQTDSRFKILDTPRISTSNNVQATIDVGQKVPYITGQEATGIGTALISTYDFLPVGVTLKVTPRISSNDQVTMDVDQSADDVESYTSYNAPLVDHREAGTTVTVQDGQTIILGGIIQRSVTTTVNKFPILGDIPLLGYLFQQSNKDYNQTELMVLLTPHIIHNNSDAQVQRQAATKELTKDSQGSLKKLLNEPTPPPPDPTKP